MSAEYAFRSIEKKWQEFWEKNQTYRTEIDHQKPKFYILDMFPYPSGAGLHVGHPLGYIASDVFSRYKTLKGFNVLHPMGFDSFGLPAEQYAIQTGQHPALTTEQNINTFIQQLRNIGFSYDWSREVRTSDPQYYRWTQWIFCQLFEHYYDKIQDKALPISGLEQIFAQKGNQQLSAVSDEDTPTFSAAEWQAMSSAAQQSILLKYRLTFPEESFVNWCPGLGTVLSNDEVKDGVSERGGYPVERKLMKQWSMRITAYADRLINGLSEVDWSDSLKEQQRNWIGRSVGASVRFGLEGQPVDYIEVFTTRVDTIYGCSFMVLAPEHELVASLTTPEQQTEVEAYVKWAAGRSEVDRMSEVKKVSGVFTGSFCANPFNGEKVPIYLADYVLAGYGTGAVMGVPSGDQRDWNFATHFSLPIIPILDAQKDIDQQADNTKEGRYINSGQINGLGYAEATQKLIDWLEERGLGKGKIQYRLRNAVFSRQRYWGEPVPAFWKDGLPQLIDEAELPLILPEIEKYLPTQTGEPPLGRAEDWKYQHQGQSYSYELSTMPGWAGSSWYWYRYMDPQNNEAMASPEAIDYWQRIDLYMGGSEHATGHLLYSRFWNHFLYDLGLVPHREYAAKLINQGMIQGRSNFVYRLKDSEGEGKTPVFVSLGLRDQYETTALHVDVNIVEDDVLDVKAFKQWRADFAEATFILENGQYRCGWEVEKMSKRWYNVVNPDDVVEKYGADTLRLYEMFLGPLTDSKPWNTSGIAGSHNFLRKVWRLFFEENKGWKVSDEAPTAAEWKVLHTAIKKVEDDLERFSFNTVVSALMICTNELTSLRCSKRAILQELLVLLSPYAPHISEELWAQLGHTTSITKAQFPQLDMTYLEESQFEYPVSINGKVRAKITMAADMSQADMEATILADPKIQAQLAGATPKKIIIVPKRIVNVVV
jgi:leucyl-tRNA synthetase